MQQNGIRSQLTEKTAELVDVVFGSLGYSWFVPLILHVEGK